MNLIEKFARKTDTDDYFKKLYRKLERKYFNKILFAINQEELSRKEFFDLLRYADILCRSAESNYRQKSYKIISLLNEFYNDNIEFKTYAETILIKLGNFPAKHLINHDEEIYTDSEIKLEKATKEIYQATPDERYVFTDRQY